MSSATLRLSIVVACYCAAQGLAQPPTAQLNPAVKKIVDEVSEERIGAIMKKLGDFGTRYVASETDNPAHGIGGASKWIEGELKSYSPRLEVSEQPFSVPKTQRTPRDLDLVERRRRAARNDRQGPLRHHLRPLRFHRAAARPQTGGVRTDDAGPASARRCRTARPRRGR